jgi:hypothetical protein
MLNHQSLTYTTVCPHPQRIYELPELVNRATHVLAELTPSWPMAAKWVNILRTSPNVGTCANPGAGLGAAAGGVGGVGGGTTMTIEAFVRADVAGDVEEGVVAHNSLQGPLALNASARSRTVTPMASPAVDLGNGNGHGAGIGVGAGVGPGPSMPPGGELQQQQRQHQHQQKQQQQPRLNMQVQGLSQGIPQMPIQLPHQAPVQPMNLPSSMAAPPLPASAMGQLREAWAGAPQPPTDALHTLALAAAEQPTPGSLMYGTPNSNLNSNINSNGTPNLGLNPMQMQMQNQMQMSMLPYVDMPFGDPTQQQSFHDVLAYMNGEPQWGR